MCKQIQPRKITSIPSTWMALSYNIWVTRKHVSMKEATPFARANSVSAIEGRNVCNMAWTPSTIMREKSALFGQVLQNTSHWLVQVRTTAQDTYNILKSYTFPLSLLGCPWHSTKPPFSPATTFVDMVFLSHLAEVWYRS